MIAASPLSGCPLVEPATQNRRWPSEGKDTTIGSTVGVIMNRWGVSPCYTNPPVAKADHRNDANTHRNATKSYPHPPKPSPTIWGNQCGPDDRDCHTHTQARRTIVPKTPATPLTTAMHQDPTSRRCGNARRRSTPTTRRCTNNTQSQGHRAVCPSATHMSTM